MNLILKIISFIISCPNDNHSNYIIIRNNVETKRTILRKVKSKSKYLFIILLTFSLFSLVKGQDKFFSNYSYISLIINKIGNKQIFNPEENNNCKNKALPNMIQINGINQSNITSNYDFERSNDNNIILIWNEAPNSTSCLFYNCTDIEEIDLSNFDSSKVVDMSYMFTYCKLLNFINFQNFNTSNTIYMNYKFKDCRSLASLNLSNFDTSKVSRMERMFHLCDKLTSLDLSNFKTSNVLDMSNMFDDCYRLSYLDVSSFDTSKVANMINMFNDCRELTSLNLSNFNISNISRLNQLFYNCKSLESLNLSNFNTQKIENLGNMFYGCSSLKYLNLSNFDTSNVINIDNMFYGCWSLTSLDLSNFNTSLIKNMNKVFYNCTKLEYINLKLATLRNDVKTDNIFSLVSQNLVICSQSEKWQYMISNEPLTIYCNNNKIHNLNSLKCYTNISTFENINNKCKSCGINYYQLYNDSLYINNNKGKISSIYCYESPEGFYLDKNNNNPFYKPCYESCKKCNIIGNATHHNCTECKLDFYFELNLKSFKNCYNNCSFYYYKDKYNDIFYCTERKECPEKYNKLISEKKECIHKCEEDDNYKYEFRKECYKECPEGSIKQDNISMIDKFFCKPVCLEDKPFEIISIQECVKNCPIKDLQNNLCILNYKGNQIENVNENKDKKNNEEENLKAQELMLQNIEEGFTSDDYDTSNLEKGEDDIIKDEKMTITLTTTDNQKNNINNNATLIDLSECETILRNKYNIPEDEKLYMKKVDLVQEGMKIPKVEYDVYCKLNGSNLNKLNLSVCENSKVSLSVPVILSESLDKLNSSSAYYNDICYTATSDSGTDISLKDRKNEFIEGNKTVCQDDCDFSEYDYTTQKAKCSCKVKESTNSILDMKINKTKLYENFIDIKNIANIKLMVCYKVLFSKNGIKSNIACFSIIPIIIFHLITIFIFYKNQKVKIYDKINDITFGISNWNLVKEYEKERNRIETMNKRMKRLNKKNKKKIIFKKKKRITILSNPMMKSHKKKK